MYRQKTFEPCRVETMRNGSRAQMFFTALMLAASVASAPAARAQGVAPSVPLGASSCETDVKSMQDRRMKLINEFNQMAKAHAGKLDPVESCPKLKSLSALENSFKQYMVKNKDWCNIPDEAITNVSESQSKTASLATRVCAVAAQFKKQQQQQQAAGGLGAPPAPKLPAGPL